MRIDEEDTEKRKLDLSLNPFFMLAKEVEEFDWNLRKHRYGSVVSLTCNRGRRETLLFASTLDARAWFEANVKGKKDDEIPDWF